MRPWQLWRHELEHAASVRRARLSRDDAQYTVSVGRSRDDRIIVVMLNSSMTSEVRYLLADDPTGTFLVFETSTPRHRIRRRALRRLAGNRRWWLKMTNEDATDFRLLARLAERRRWREIVAERPAVASTASTPFRTSSR
jgi:protease II